MFGWQLKAAADDYPNRVVELIVPFPPGGGVDTEGRVIAQKLSDALGKQVIVVNKPGAGSVIGVRDAAKAAPDGYTILMLVTGASLPANTGYDLEKDFTPIGLIASIPIVIMANPSVPVKTMADIVALAKKKPGTLTVGTPPAPTLNYFGAEAFKGMSGADMTIVTYKGTGPLTTDLLGGHVMIGFNTLPPAIGNIKAGKIRAIAVAAPQRLAAVPDVPTTAEAGMPGLDIVQYYGLVAPAGTPKPIIEVQSLELFGRIVGRIPTLRVLLIMTFRPEFEPPWIGRPYVTVLTINRLAEREVGAMIDRVIGNKLLPAGARHDIVERTDGIPLFVEEMTKAVLEAGSESAAEHTAAAVPSPSLAVPASLHASLMARLDRLGTAKEVAQVGAAIGREFSHDLLAAVVRKPEAELNWALDRLIATGLLFRQGVPPQTTYLFKHALVQDAAYGTLLREPRRALHARIADILESQFVEVAERLPELVARHCTEARQIEKAAGLWGKAGLRSLERSALVEATEQLTRAHDQIGALPATRALRLEQIKVQVGLANALMHVKGYAAPETKVAIERARLFIERSEALGEPLEDPLMLFSALYGHWATNFVAFNGDICRDLATHFLALAEKQGATTPILIGHRIMGNSLLKGGNFVQARTHYDRGIAIYDPVEHRTLATRFGHDTGVAIFCYRSWTLWFLGYPEAALRDAAAAVENARETDQAASLMFALHMTAVFHVLCGNYAVATARARELFAVAEEKGALMWKASGVMHEGCALAATGKASSAIEMLTAGITGYRSTGATSSITSYLSYLARAYGNVGQFDDAWRCIDEAMTVIGNANERWFEAEVYRIAGEIARLSAEPDAAKAEAYFERALAVARQQQAKSWELRAAMSLARLWRDQGKAQQARELLAPVYGWFTEGFDTRDLKEAKSLLLELGACFDG